MKNCKYSLYDNEGNEIKFESMFELDHFLFSQVKNDDFLKNKLDSNILYKSRFDTTIDVLDKMKLHISKKSKTVHKKYDPDLGGVESYNIIENSIGVSKVITDIPIDGNILVTKLNKEDYFENQGFSNEQIDIVEKGWNFETSAGTGIHKIGQQVLNKESVDIPKSFDGDTELFNHIKNEFINFNDYLKQRHGENFKIYTEFDIISKKLQSPFDRLEYDGKSIDTINGTIDVLVIDSNGFAHIYDYKNSKKDPGFWPTLQNVDISEENWSSTKKLSIEYQMELYRTILEQWGIKVASVNILPIKVTYDYVDNHGIKTPTKINGISIKHKNIIQDGPSGLKRRSNKIKSILPIKYITDKIDGINSIVEPASIMWGAYDLSTSIERSRASFDHEKSKVRDVPENSPDRIKGKYVFFNKFKKTDNGRVFCKDMEEVDVKINEYIQQITSETSNEMANLSNQIIAIQSGSKDFETFELTTASRHENDYLKKTFKRFLDSEKTWHFQENPSLAAAGIFVFTDDNGVAEIVVLTEQIIDQEINLGKGKNILGSFKRDFEVDEHTTLRATNGNLNLMKVMTLLNSAKENFSGYKINSIEVHNPRTQNGTTESMDVLYKNFVDAARLTNGKVKLNLNSSDFTSTLEYTQRKVEDLCGDSLMKLYGVEFAYDIDTIYDGINKLEHIRQVLLRDRIVFEEINSDKPNFSIPEVEAYKLVVEAKLKLLNYRVYIEPNPAPNIETNGRLHVGANWSSSEMSPSLNIQTVGNIVAQASTKVRQAVSKTMAKYRKAEQALFEYKKRNSLFGGEIRYYDNLFETKDGKKDSRFILKRENDPSLAPAEREFLKIFLEIKNEFKYRNNPSRLNEIRNTDEYYECPITIGDTRALFHNNNMKDVAKVKYNEALNFLGIFNQQESELASYRKQYVAYNKYDIGSDVRNKILNENDINIFETDLSRILGDLVTSYHKEDIWNSVLPQIQGIKLVLQYNQSVFGHVSSETLTYIDKYVDTVLFSKPIMDPKLQGPYKFLNAVRSVTGATVLGFNVRSGIRELMQGMWNHISRSMVQMYGKNMFKSSEILKAWTIVFKLSINNPNLITLLDVINAEYGMANADVDSIKELLSQSKSGLLNFGSDDLYIMNQIPDAYHRLGILIAQMIHDGCWEAHSQDDNGNLFYDFNKDERFNLLTNKNSDKKSEKYKSQLDLYLSMCDQFRLEGYEIPQYDGTIHPLPRAYTIQEGSSIKSFADLCFGHYDKRTQMLAKHMFLGSFFLQFRTFLSAKLEQWILKPGTYNIGSYKEKFDVDGVRIMRVIKFDDNGIPKIEFKREDEVSEGEIVMPHKEWQGRFMEGIAYSMWDFGNALAKMNTQDLKELWENDTKRANLYLFINDMILMNIMMAIIQALFINNEDIEWTPGSHMLAMALYTSFSDGPITQLLSSMGGDLNPPMYSQVKNIYNNTVNMVTGDIKISEYFTGTFGALRDLEYLIK